MKETYSRTKSVWQRMDETERKAVMDYGEKYKAFLDTARTERLAAKEIIRQAEAKGFKPVYDMKSLKAGDKVYWNQKDKSVILAVIGEEPVHEGIKIVGSHIDSPRLDLKANPVHEQEGVVYFRTHYYGGIKKYQWTCIPLALIGVVYTKDGRKVEINIGLKDSDPVFYISDLLIHMAQDQMKKSLAEGITGEQLQPIIATNSDENQKPKEALMKMFKDTYGIEEEDFAAAELELVPAEKSRDVGFDRSLIASYGQDDRVCAYTSLLAMLEMDTPKHTSCCLFTDKEEIGSVGATGMQSRFFENAVAELLDAMGCYSDLRLRRTLKNSSMLSSDVSAGYDPAYGEAFEKKNAAYLGRGIVLNKFTGARGKSGSNDANAEYVARVRNIFDSHEVAFQTAELGKVDVGGGGTIAYIAALYGMEVIDSGVAVLSMHAPWEVTSKADIYEAKKAYKAFLLEA